MSNPDQPPKLAILMLDATALTEPGAVANPDSFGVDVDYRVVAGATGSRITGSTEDRRLLADEYVRTAKLLVGEGATMLTTNCGFTIDYQDLIQRSTETPTVTSALLLLPVQKRVYGGALGLLTYDAEVLEDLTDESVSVDGIEMADVTDSAAWKALGDDGRPPVDVEAMRHDLVDVAVRLVVEHRLRALLLECTGFAPFTGDIEVATGVPVFDIVGVTRFLLALDRLGGDSA